jgi:phage FluMu protein Com
MSAATEKTIVRCVKCGQRLRAPVDSGTVKLRCPTCKAEFEFTLPVDSQPSGWFTRATDLFESERYEEALVCFQEARRLHHPHAARAVARCREKLGKTAHERLFAWGDEADDVAPP